MTVSPPAAGPGCGIHAPKCADMCAAIDRDMLMNSVLLGAVLLGAVLIGAQPMAMGISRCWLAARCDGVRLRPDAEASDAAAITIALARSSDTRARPQVANMRY